LEADGADDGDIFMYASMRFLGKPSGDPEIIYESGSNDGGMTLSYISGDQVVLRKCSSGLAPQAVAFQLYDTQKGPDAPYLDVYVGAQTNGGGLILSLVVDGIEVTESFTSARVSADLSDTEDAGFMTKGSQACGVSAAGNANLISAVVDLVAGFQLFYGASLPTLAQLATNEGIV
jgi:hypothetical protein